MLATDFIIILLLLAFIFYWLDSLRAKEVATKEASAACQKVSLEFLDQTVMIKKVRLRRNHHGQLAIFREYQFEFSSTGEFRYKGRVRLLGSTLIDVDMEAYQFHELDN